MTLSMINRLFQLSSQVHFILNELVMGGMVLETNMTEILTRIEEQNKLEKEEVKQIRKYWLKKSCLIFFIPILFLPLKKERVMYHRCAFCARMPSLIECVHRPCAFP